MLVTLGGKVRRATRAVVGIPARPVEPRDGCSILAEGNRRGSQQPGLGGVEHPGKDCRMESDRDGAKTALPPCGGWTQLLKHKGFPGRRYVA